jgi:2-polyprenyl-3-methyl-5-hydroxy-6-metoxy-1,4-benzoquinol methylase
MKIDGNYFRRNRFKLVLSAIDQASTPGKVTRILDVGGTQTYWQALEPLWRGRDLDITIVNLGSESADDGPYHLRPGNACALDELADRSFDLVHSNSVIEHVGRWEAMSAMAKEVRRLAGHYYVQTPNFWFPVEPHFRTALMHWYPEAVRANMLLRKKRGFRSVDNFDAAMREVQDINLLTRRQLQTLFPDAEVKSEKLGPVTKSIIAMR